ncbi:MAG: type II toxin-antitoxin system MqsA family antitoxin [Lamprobacter sp.]|uniref:type II toxin-antitoxin system MqsA family antitoxin n=1 Tax=Lamprobacter sp. TaxID=3100796 RepID=UPI002B2599E6|nr:type II toxin-antitoxin system MqsA family antitoxin [Lamprobacter sp.]MEA3643715.1 type II toxin-antitoxin system MqsA family antitoxin [Lamprobacter sp.]
MNADKASVPCPVCGEGQLTERQERDRVAYQGQEGDIPLAFSVCDACGSEQASPVQLRANKRAMIKFQKQVDGLLPAEAIDQLLRDWAITQAQAARIFGGGAVAFSKYKHDDVKQSEPMDRLLRVAAAVPEAFAWLARRAGLSTHAKGALVRPMVIKLAQPQRPSPTSQSHYHQVDAFSTRTTVNPQPSANEDAYGLDELAMG